MLFIVKLYSGRSIATVHIAGIFIVWKQSSNQNKLLQQKTVRGIVCDVFESKREDFKADAYNITETSIFKYYFQSVSLILKHEKLFLFLSLKQSGLISHL